MFYMLITYDPNLFTQNQILSNFYNKNLHNLKDVRVITSAYLDQAINKVISLGSSQCISIHDKYAKEDLSYITSLDFKNIVIGSKPSLLKIIMGNDYESWEDINCVYNYIVPELKIINKEEIIDCFLSIETEFLHNIADNDWVPDDIKGVIIYDNNVIPFELSNRYFDFDIKTSKQWQNKLNKLFLPKVE